jgi:hypothetical protein
MLIKQKMHFKNEKQRNAICTNGNASSRPSILLPNSVPCRWNWSSHCDGYRISSVVNSKVLVNICYTFFKKTYVIQSCYICIIYLQTEINSTQCSSNKRCTLRMKNKEMQYARMVMLAASQAFYCPTQLHVVGIGQATVMVTE